MSDDSAKRARWSSTTFMLAFAATLLLLAWISVDFLFPLVLAVSAAILLGPAHERLTGWFGGRRKTAAILMSLLAAMILLGPLVAIGVRVAKELAPFLQEYAAILRGGRLSGLLHQAIPEDLRESLDVATIQQELGARLGQLAGYLGAFAAGLPVLIGNTIIDSFVAMLALYVYFVRGPQLAAAIVEATPMERHYTQRLLKTIAATIRTVFMASVVTALIQAALGWIGFKIVGLPYALALAAIMGFMSFIFSLVPVLGSGLVWAPVGAALLISGRTVAGLFILGWGALVLGSVDNVVKPLYAKGQLQLSPLLVFITLFGGISVFGPIGALLGPLIAALASAFLRIWTTDFLEDSEPLPRTVHGDGEKRRPKWLSRLVRARRDAPA
jgi:predicted PurR-regulated permease PerM